MRVLLLASILALFSTPSFARERAYRVVGSTAIDSGYALAWGMKGKALDFEELDKLPDPRKFLEDNQESLENYLVDLENETILETVLEPALVGRLGDDNVLHNHDTIGLIPMAVQGLDESEYAMGVTAEHKWFNELTKLVIVKRSATSSVVTGESTRIGNDIENTVLAKLSAADRKKFIDYQGAVSWSFSVQRDPISWAEKLIVVASSMHPKMDDPTLEITAKLVLKKQANGISIVAESAKLVEKK